MTRFVVALLLVVPALGRAQTLQDRFNIRLIAQGMYLAEQQSPIPTGYGREAQVASPFQLAYGDLRAVIDGRRLPGSFDLHLDGRVRVSGNFSTDAATVGNDQVVARGYDGGREYQVIQAWVRRRGLQWDFGLGRMVVAEADGLRIDGLRLWWRPAKHWDVSLYGGAYPDPFSRSLTSDYQGGFAFAAGADSSYTYDKIWGSLSVNAAYLGGNNDGGPLPASIADPNSTASVVGTVTTETPRTWITWTDYVRLFSWLDAFTDLVLDVTGSAGVQLTRLDALLTARAGRHVTFRAGYDHMSAFAIEMWLTRFLANRGTHVPGTVENNLIVERTARDEVRGDVEISFGKASIFADGRFRRRALVSLTDDPQFVAAGQQIAPGLAYDVTFGLRDRGSLWGLRETLWGMYLSDYRSRSVLGGVQLGRGFLDERLSLDLSFIYANTSDTLANNPTFQACSAATITTVSAQQTSCYGTRAGSTYEAGLTLSAQPGNHWFLLLDYRLVADLSGGFIVAGAGAVAALPQPTILTHVLILRIEARY